MDRSKEQREKAYMADLMKAATSPAEERYIIMDTVRHEMAKYPNASFARISAALAEFTVSSYSELTMDDHNFLAKSAKLENAGGREIWGSLF